MVRLSRKGIFLGNFLFIGFYLTDFSKKNSCLRIVLLISTPGASLSADGRTSSPRKASTCSGKERSICIQKTTFYTKRAKIKDCREFLDSLRKPDYWLPFFYAVLELFVEILTPSIPPIIAIKV
jgi:hypothetical protein